MKAIDLEVCREGALLGWQEASMKWSGLEGMVMETRGNIIIYSLASRTIMSTNFTCAAPASTPAQDAHIRLPLRNGGKVCKQKERESYSSSFHRVG